MPPSPQQYILTFPIHLTTGSENNANYLLGSMWMFAYDNAAAQRLSLLAFGISRAFFQWECTGTSGSHTPLISGHSLWQRMQLITAITNVNKDPGQRNLKYSLYLLRWDWWHHQLQISAEEWSIVSAFLFPPHFIQYAMLYRSYSAPPHAICYAMHYTGDIYFCCWGDLCLMLRDLFCKKWWCWKVSRDRNKEVVLGVG